MAKKPPRKTLGQKPDDWFDPSRAYSHWGRWIWERATFLGYRRQQDLIEAIDCNRTTFFKWLKSPSPPNRILKGLDLNLARALKVDRKMLFTGWRLSRADDAPVLESDEGGEFKERADLIDKISRGMSAIDEIQQLREVYALVHRYALQIGDKVVERMHRDEGRPPVRPRH